MNKQHYLLSFATVFLFLLFGCSGESYRTDRSNHNRMIAELDSIVNDAKDNPLKYFHANKFRVAFLDSIVDANPQDARLRYYFAIENQNSEQIEQSIPILSDLSERLTNAGPRRMATEALAISYLRLAEINNCFENYTPSNCILPFDDEAVHENKDYVQSAINELEILLNNNPGDYTYHWMYNIAHIANNTYPDGLNEDYLIPGLQNEENLSDNLKVPKFRDVGMAKGVGDDRISGSACTEDFTGDGNLDIFTTSYGFGDDVIFYESNGAGGFSDHTQEAGLSGMMGGLNIVCADINNSGYPAVLILRGAWLAQHGEHPNSLLRNNGDGTFTDITHSSGLYEKMPSQVAAFTDINLDGNIDIFIGNESASEWQGYFVEEDEESPSYPSAMFINNGDETFSKHEVLNGFSLNEFVKGASWGDINNDGWPDLYVSVMGANNKLFVHRGLDEDGQPQFKEIAQQAGVSQPQFSFPVWFFDYDNDGLDDIFVTTYDVRSINRAADEVSREWLDLQTQSEYSRLYKNMGNETFRDVTEEMGLNTVMFGMGANFGDLNNDGYPDMYIGTGAPSLSSIIPNRLFLNHRGESFYESTAISGVGHLQKGHGVSMADFNEDGLLDIYMVLGGAVESDYYHNALFENQTSTGNWLTLKLEGTSANRQAIGTKVELQVPSGDSTRSLHKTVSTGGSFGNNSSRLHFGIGDANVIERIIIKWPGSDEPQTINNLKANTFLHIKQKSK